MERVRKSEASWGSRYAGTLVISDLVVVSWAIAGAHSFRFNPEGSSASLGCLFFVLISALVYYSALFGSVSAWWLPLTLVDPRAPSTLAPEAAGRKRLLVEPFDASGAFAMAFPGGWLVPLLPRAAWRALFRFRRRLAMTSAVPVMASSGSNVSKSAKEVPLLGAGSDCVTAHELTGGLEWTYAEVLSDADDIELASPNCSANALILSKHAPMCPRPWRSGGGINQSYGVDMAPTSFQRVADQLRRAQPFYGLPLLYVQVRRLDREVLKEAFHCYVTAQRSTSMAALWAVVDLTVAVLSCRQVSCSKKPIVVQMHPFGILGFGSGRRRTTKAFPHLPTKQSHGHKLLFRLALDHWGVPVGLENRKYVIVDLLQLWSMLVEATFLVGLPLQYQSKYDFYVPMAGTRLSYKTGLTSLGARCHQPSVTACIVSNQLFVR